MAPATTHLFYVGTYTKTTSRGIYAVRLDANTGALTTPELAAETTQPTFLAFSPGKKFLYAVRNSQAMAVGFALDAVGRLNALPASAAPAADAPCHLAVDQSARLLIVTHYGSGFVATLPIHADGTLGPPAITQHTGKSVHPERQSVPHTHSVTISPDNRFALVCDLGLDKIFTYALEPAAARITPGNPAFTATAPGAGPRHSAFSPEGRHVYVINEVDNTLVTYAYDAARGALALIDTHSTLPADFTGTNTTAEVRVHPNGKFVYGSNRGHDSLAVFARDAKTGALTPVEIVPCGGKHPRNFALSPDGAWLVCAHMNSDTLAVFQVDANSGRLTRVGGTVSVPMPVCVLFFD